MAPAARKTSPAPLVRRRNRAATEVTLVKAAEEVFAERGYEAATTRAIAERAGCSEALIQNYFRGKEGLLLAVIQQEEGGPMDQTAFFERPLCATVEDEARETMRHIVGLLGSRTTRLRIVLSRVLIDPQFREEFNRVTVRTFLLASLERRFGRYVSEGRLPRGFDARLAAEMLIALNFQLGFIDREILRIGPRETQRRIDSYAAVFGRGILAVTK